MESTTQPQSTPNTRYILDSRIGHGGGGSVFRAWDSELGRYVAIKRLHADREIDANLRREAGILAGLQHPNIVTIFDVNVDEAGVFVVMELVIGYTLGEIADEQPMDIQAFLYMADQICRGLTVAHSRGLIHHDIKPSNIMFHYHEDQSFTVKILDFGLARHGTANIAKDAPIFASVDTVAPEQLLHQPIDARTDIYSLGCLFYFALLGRFPFSGTMEEIVQAHTERIPTPLHLYRAEVPQHISELIQQMLAIDPGARPESMEVVRQRLQGQPAEEFVPSTSPGRHSSKIANPQGETGVTSTVIVTAPPATKSIMPLLVAAVVILALMLGIGGFVLAVRSSRGPATASAQPSAAPAATAAPAASAAPTAAPAAPVHKAPVAAPVTVQSSNVQLNKTSTELIYEQRFNDAKGISLQAGAAIAGDGSGVSGRSHVRSYDGAAASLQPGGKGPIGLVDLGNRDVPNGDEVTVTGWYKARGDQKADTTLLCGLETSLVLNPDSTWSFHVNAKMPDASQKDWFDSGNNAPLKSWMPAGQWVFIAVVWKRSTNTADFYQGSRTIPLTLTNSVKRPESVDVLRQPKPLKMTVGNHPWYRDRSFDGQVDDVRFFNKAIDPQTIERIRQADLKDEDV